MPAFDVLIFSFMELFGLLVIGVALWAIRRTRRLLATGERVLGRAARGGTGDGAAQYAVVEFTTKDGRKGEAWSLRRAGRPTQDLEIPVIYDPSNPKHAVIDQKLQVWGVPVFLLFTGVTSALFPVVILALR